VCRDIGLLPSYGTLPNRRVDSNPLQQPSPNDQGPVDSPGITFELPPRDLADLADSQLLDELQFGLQHLQGMVHAGTVTTRITDVERMQHIQVSGQDVATDPLPVWPAAILSAASSSSYPSLPHFRYPTPGVPMRSPCVAGGGQLAHGAATAGRDAAANRMASGRSDAAGGGSNERA